MGFFAVISLHSSCYVESIHFDFNVPCVLDKYYCIVLLNLPLRSKASRVEKHLLFPESSQQISFGSLEESRISVYSLQTLHDLGLFYNSEVCLMP